MFQPVAAFLSMINWPTSLHGIVVNNLIHLSFMLNSVILLTDFSRVMHILWHSQLNTIGQQQSTFDFHLKQHSEFHRQFSSYQLCHRGSFAVGHDENWPPPHIISCDRIVHDHNCPFTVFQNTHVPLIKETRPQQRTINHLRCRLHRYVLPINQIQIHHQVPTFWTWLIIQSRYNWNTSDYMAV